MKQVNATQLRGDLFNILKSIVKSHEEYHVTAKTGDVVILPRDDYEDLIETLELLSIPGFRKSLKESLKEIQKGNHYSMEDVFGE